MLEFRWMLSRLEKEQSCEKKKKRKRDLYNTRRERKEEEEEERKEETFRLTLTLRKEHG